MTRTTFLAALLAAAAALAGPAAAQMAGHAAGADHGAMDAPAAGGFGEAMEAMTRSMDAVEMTGDADVDFLLMMIPHHQSAVDMARGLLAHAGDPEVAAFAGAVVAAQEAEIAAMRAMLARLERPAE